MCIRDRTTTAPETVAPETVAPETVAPTTSTAPPASTAAPTTTTTTEAPAPPLAPLSTWVVTATDQVTHLVAYDAPAGNIIPFEFLVPNPHQFGGPQVLMVTEGGPDDDWVQVQLPIRPNGQTGWIDASLYEFSQTQIRAEVNLSERSIIVYDGTEILAETRAVIGSPATPTPLGTFFITAKRRSLPSESSLARGRWRSRHSPKSMKRSMAVCPSLQFTERAGLTRLAMLVRMAACVFQMMW